MMIDDTAFAAWLRTNATRVVLVEMDYKVEQDTEVGSPTVIESTPVTGTVRMSTHVYSKQSDVRYFECVRTVPTYNREVDKARLGGAASISFGSVELDNPDGQMDFLLDLACDGSQIRFYVGDESWERADFRLMYTALVQYITSASPPQISIAIRDVGLLIDKSIGGDQLIGGSGPNADQPRAYFFGHVHNIECKLKEFGPLLYDYAESGSVADVNSPPEGGVRDQGLAVVYTDNGDGTLNLSASPAGTITADLYRQIEDALPGARVSQCIDELMRTKIGLTTPEQYIGPHPSFYVGGPDDYPVGLYVTEKTNVQDLLAQLMDTGLCFYGTTRLGQFTFGRLWPHDIPSLHLPIRAELSEEDAVAPDSIAIERVVPTYYAVPVIVNKNWTTQTTFAGALTADEQARYTRKGFYVDPTIAPENNSYALEPQLYHLTLVKAAAQETLISASSDDRVLDAALRWIDSRKNQLLPWTEFVEITVDLRYYFLELGDVVTFDYGGRFGYDGDQFLQVCGIDMAVADNTIKLILVRRRIPNVSELSYDDIV